MNMILRDPEKAKDKIYDAIIIGGGIYGVMLSLIASQKGLKTLLLERDDFGGATSFNSLRIVHGGLRYLQKLDFHRFYESVSERKWFIKNFPEFVQPLPCLMPLYGKGLYRPSIFRAALLLNDILSMKRNKGLLDGSRLPGGRIISAKEVENIFPDVDTSGLKGGALWYDGSMPDSQRVLIELLKRSCSLGAEALNYFEAKELLKKGDNVAGVKALDSESKIYYNFNSKVVLNAAGPWCRKIASHFDKDYQNLFKSSIAWNVLFNKKAPSDHALAVTPKRPNAKIYFLRPWKGMLFAGTIHEPWNGITKNPLPSENSIKTFIDDLNSLVKNLNLKREDALHIYSGLLPAKENGSEKLAVREVILDHSESGGPKGLFSISGVKLTTARLVAEKTINKIFPEKEDKVSEFLNSQIKKEYAGLFDFNWHPEKDDSSWKEILLKIINNESVVHLDDLILRRTSIGDNPARAIDLARKICYLFGWDNERVENERERLKKSYNT